jgi:predicted GIY-YIG superfamily endonuclease
MENIDKTCIYALKLESDKYYIGKSDNVDERINQHFAGYGSSWTSEYKPISVIEKIYSDDPFDEDKYVKKYMHKYGIDNVRGGTYSCIYLCDDEVCILTREIRHANGACLRCGHNGHFIIDCFASNSKDGYKIIE